MHLAGSPGSYFAYLKDCLKERSRKLECKLSMAETKILRKVNKNRSKLVDKLKQESFNSLSNFNLTLKEVYFPDRLTDCKQNSFKRFLV